MAPIVPSYDVRCRICSAISRPAPAAESDDRKHHKRTLPAEADAAGYASLTARPPAQTGFDTGRGVTVKISQGCIALITDGDEVQALREQLYQVRQVVKGVKEAVV